LVYTIIWKKPSGRSNNFPQKGRGLGHVTPKVFGIRLNICSKLLQLESSNLVYSFSWEKPSGRSNNFPQKGRGLGHVTTKNFRNTIESNLSSKLLELETLNIVHSFHLEKPSGRANNFPQKERGLGHVTPWHTIEHIFKTTRARVFKFGSSGKGVRALK